MKLKADDEVLECVIMAFGIKWKYRRGASWIREQTKVEDILIKIKIKIKNDMGRTQYAPNS